MKQSIFKPIVAGILLGTFVFFTGPLLFIVLLLKFIFTPFGMGRIGRFSGLGFGGGRGMFMAGGRPGFGFADKIRSMSEEDYTAFKTKFQERFTGGCGTGCGNKKENQ